VRLAPGDPCASPSLAGRSRTSAELTRAGDEVIVRTTPFITADRSRMGVAVVIDPILRSV